jgi:hypothetical protein
MRFSALSYPTPPRPCKATNDAFFGGAKSILIASMVLTLPVKSSLRPYGRV